MHLDLSDDEAAALAQELHAIVENDRYSLSPRIRMLRGILAKFGPIGPAPPPTGEAADAGGARPETTAAPRVGGQGKSTARGAFSFVETAVGI